MCLHSSFLDSTQVDRVSVFGHSYRHRLLSTHCYWSGTPLQEQRAASLSSFPVWLWILGVVSDFSHKYSKVTLILRFVFNQKSSLVLIFYYYFIYLFCFLLDLYAVIGCGGALLTVCKTSVCDDIYNEALRWKFPCNFSPFTKQKHVCN